MSGFVEPDDVPEMFQTNFAKEGIVYSKDHPYFNVDAKDKNLALINFNLPLP